MIDSRLMPLFAPRTVAVIGASRDPAKVGGSVLANLRAAGFPGRVIAVNAGADEVQGLPAVRSVRDVPDAIDLAVIAVPAPAVLPALKECAARGVGVAVVISAGFRETDATGRDREAELRAWVAEHPVRVMGPNCLGWIRPSARLNVTFAPGMPLPGPIAFVSHSGALAVAILDWARDRHLGFSVFASLGNQADLNESDVLDAVTDDPETRVIVAYVEGVADGARFLGALRRAAAIKPVVVLKAGRSAEGARAVSSHTGALAGSDQAFDAAVRRAGAVRATTVEELFDLARGLATQPLPRGRRLLVVTNGGGLGIVAADAARERGLSLPALDPPARERLRAVLPAAASAANPVDLVGDAGAARYAAALRAAGAESADAALVILTAQAATEPLGVARAVLATTRDWPIPVAAAFVGGARVIAGARALEEAGLPCYSFPERAVAALAGMAQVAERWRTRRDTIVPGARSEAIDAIVRGLGVGQLGMASLHPLLEAHGITTAKCAVARTPREAAALAQRLSGPVALKLVSPDVTHKTEVGGVRVGLRSPDEVETAARAMLERIGREHPGARVEGLLVQEMVEDGPELLVGMVRDPQFGPLVLVGFGGIYVEILGDTAARLAPFDAEEAREMLEELRMAPVLRGARGRAPVDMASLAATVSRFSLLAATTPELAELEVNPLIAGTRGVVAVDARARCAIGGERR